MSKVKVTIQVVFEEMADYKTHMALVKDRVNAFLKDPSDRDLASGSQESAWSSHSYSIEEVEK